LCPEKEASIKRKNYNLAGRGAFYIGKRLSGYCCILKTGSGMDSIVRIPGTSNLITADKDSLYGVVRVP